MFIEPLGTSGSRTAAGTIILLLLALPIVSSLVPDQDLRTALFYVVAISIGCGLGWVAGDTLKNSPAVGKIVAVAVVAAIGFAGLFLPVSTLLKDGGQPDLTALFHALFAVPIQEPSIGGAVMFSTMAFVVMAIVAGAFVTPTISRGPSDASAQQVAAAADSGPSRPRYNYEAMIAWGTVGSACGTGIAVVALGLALVQFMMAENRWQKEVAIKAIGDENLDKPFISRHCLGALDSLEEPKLKQVTERKPVKLSAVQADLVGRCFADLDGDTQSKVYRIEDGDPANPILTEKGTALLAQRVNYTLSKDGIVASLLKYKVADRALVSSEYGQRMCRYDKGLVIKLVKMGVMSKKDSLFIVLTSDFCPKELD